MTRSQIEKIITPNQVITEFERVVNGKDESGFDTYKIVYIETPLNYKLVHLDNDSNLAVLEDLDK